MTNKKTGVGWKIVLGILLFLIVLVVGAGILLSDDETKIETSQPAKTLSARIRFDGTQFTITNNNTFNWTNVKFELNSGILKGGYILRQGRIKAKNTYTVGALQFAKSDGTRFNPFTMKPQSIFIFADQGSCDLYWE